jgi:hypothetical protein
MAENRVQWLHFPNAVLSVGVDVEGEELLRLAEGLQMDDCSHSTGSQHFRLAGVAGRCTAPTLSLQLLICMTLRPCQALSYDVCLCAKWQLKRATF